MILVRLACAQSILTPTVVRTMRLVSGLEAFDWLHN